MASGLASWGRFFFDRLQRLQVVSRQFNWPLAPAPSPPTIGVFALSAIHVDCRVIVQNYIQERVMDLQIAVVFDETQLAEFVHEEVHTQASGADHLGKSGLADFC